MFGGPRDSDANDDKLRMLEATRKTYLGREDVSLAYALN
jgi:hypothetical protein